MNLSPEERAAWLEAADELEREAYTLSGLDTLILLIHVKRIRRMVWASTQAPEPLPLRETPR
jgi:hypothetical protein